VGIFNRKKQESVMDLEALMPKATNRLSTSPFVYIGGMNMAGVVVTEDIAMQNPTVAACVDTITSAVSGLPLKIYKMDGTSATDPAFDHTLWSVLHDAPNPETTRHKFWETMMYNLLLYGNAYAQIQRDGAGRACGLYILLPSRTDIFRDPNTQKLYYTYQKPDDEFLPGAQSGQNNLAFEDVLHIKDLTVDGLQGISRVARAKNAVGLIIAYEQYSASFFRNGAVPVYYLTAPDTIPNPDKVISGIEAQLKGARNAGKAIALGGGMEIKTIGFSPEQSQLTESRKFQTDEICRIFRVPANMIFNKDHSGYNNSQHETETFGKFNLRPWLDNIEQEMKLKLLLPDERKKYDIRFNMDGLLRADYTARMDGYTKGIGSGFYSINDVRAFENLPKLTPEEGGDIHFVQGANVPLKDVGAPYRNNNSEPKTTPKEQSDRIKS
jgi:HK97 family phage portal protein